MEKSFISNLKTPCKNRGVKLEIDPNFDGVILNGNRFETMRDAEDYLSDIPRIDL